MIKVGFIGMGNFGFALASHLSRCQNPEVELWVYDRNPDVRAQLQATQTHPRLFPTISLAANLQVANSLQQLAENCQIIVLAVVSTALEEVLGQLQAHLRPQVVLLSAMKALCVNTGQPLTDTMAQILGNFPYTPAVFAGGTTAAALVGEEYLGATIACGQQQIGQKLQNIFANPYLRVQLSSDVIGVQYASSLKNVISVLVGILKGLGFAYGTQTHGLSLLASECENLALSLGAQKQTFSLASQCWGNDMVMSATSDTRNHHLGVLLGEGQRFSAAVAAMKEQGKTAESAHTLQVLPQIAPLQNYPLLAFLAALAKEKVMAHQVIKIIEQTNQL